MPDTYKQSELEEEYTRLDGSFKRRARLDIRAVLSLAPREAKTVLTALEQGHVDGSRYSGQCACLIGTLMKATGERSVNFVWRGRGLNGVSPAEAWFAWIDKGDTPATNPFSRDAYAWITEWCEERGLLK